ncbi:hypothetical protein, variant [Aphanomyces invadans]|uniref:Uncharacterized protein n=1 Tax=Aphanomyces invadans TaxID=157072 RepID=A0A024UDE8_9STRA|nr:hypothetical protein, variant [Aphanomyces invadans]ETW04250.1 hypothetical protein, variant [Aphanomyces invadans]|eukprot:XP_008867206.1 hypothetical protein, variant [Aphanomyces invadans]
MGDKEKRQVIKLHKQFLEEIDACNVLERQGLQGFSSLVNIAQRLPLVMSEKESKYGVLDGMNSIRVFLKKRHFESLEKTSTYIAQVIQGFFDRVENMQRAMSTCADVLDRMPIQDQHVFVVELMEWMENVLAMYEREAGRKKILGQCLEYWNLPDLQTRHAQWMSSSVHGCIKAEYVSMVVEAFASPIPA